MQIVVSLSVSPRRNMEADDDVDNDYRKYYATWCHACHDTTPSKHIQDRDAPDPNPDKGSTCTCAQRVTSSPTVSSCIFREHDIVSGFFLQSSWCDFWGNKRAVHIREEKPDKQK